MSFLIICFPVTFSSQIDYKVNIQRWLFDKNPPIFDERHEIKFRGAWPSTLSYRCFTKLLWATRIS